MPQRSRFASLSLARPLQDRSVSWDAHGLRLRRRKKAPVPVPRALRHRDPLMRSRPGLKRLASPAVSTDPLLTSGGRTWGIGEPCLTCHPPYVDLLAGTSTGPGLGIPFVDHDRRARSRLHRPRERWDATLCTCSVRRVSTRCGKEALKREQLPDPQKY